MAPNVYCFPSLKSLIKNIEIRLEGTGKEWIAMGTEIFILQLYM